MPLLGAVVSSHSNQRIYCRFAQAPTERVLHTVVSGMLSVPDEVPATSSDGNTLEAEGKVDSTKRPTGDLSVD